MTAPPTRTPEEITSAIGSTVLRFAHIESMMGLLVAFQYAKSAHYPEFMADVLADEGFSYGLRCNVLRKILIRSGRTKKVAGAATQTLRELGTTRNLIAHTGKLGFAAGPEAGYLHPKEVDTMISDTDLADLCARFDAQYAEAFKLVRAWLDEFSPYARAFRHIEAHVEAAASADAPEGDAPRHQEPKPDEPKE